MNKKNYLWGMLIIMMVAMLSVGLTSCSSDETEDVSPQTKDPEEVKVCFVYTLDTSIGSPMTRATGDDIFNEFYAKISNRDLIPDEYQLTLTETTTGVKYEFNGKWSAKDLITIRTGKYKVEGYTTASGTHIQEKCSIKFDEEIDITSSSSTISLTAQYNCFLLVFIDDNITNLANIYRADGNKGYETFEDFFSLSNYRYAFVNYTLYNSKHTGNGERISGEYKNGSSFIIYTKNLTFEKGKYYIYNSVTNSFSIPKMEAGE